MSYVSGRDDGLQRLIEDLRGKLEYARKLSAKDQRDKVKLILKIKELMAEREATKVEPVS